MRKEYNTRQEKRRQDKRSEDKTREEISAPAENDPSILQLVT